MVATGFERDMDGCPFRRLARVSQRENLGVRPAKAFVMAEPDKLAVANDHRADHRIGFDGTSSARRLGEGSGHPEFVAAVQDRANLGEFKRVETLPVA